MPAAGCVRNRHERHGAELRPTQTHYTDAATGDVPAHQRRRAEPPGRLRKAVSRSGSLKVWQQTGGSGKGGKAVTGSTPAFMPQDQPARADASPGG